MTQRPTGPSGQPANKRPSPNRPGGRGRPGDKPAQPSSKLVTVGGSIAAVLGLILVAIVAINYLTEFRPQQVKIPTQPASGKVLVNKKGVEGVSLIFWPVNDDKKTPRPHAVTGPGGVFKLSTFGDNDGAPPGDYKVSAHWFEAVASPKDDSEQPNQRDKLHGYYGEPRIKITIKPGVEEIDPINLLMQ